METTFIPLSQLDTPGLARLVALHCAVMHTLLADLGQPVVRRYYELAQTDPFVISFCAVSTSGEIDGWAMGSPAPAALYSKLSKSRPGWFAGQMLRLAFTRPSALINLLRSLFSASEANLIHPGQIELTFMGVASHAQGRGLGKAMLAAFMENSRLAGYTSVAISVETDNASTIRLHARAGFQITKTFTEGRYHRHRMEYSRIDNRKSLIENPVPPSPGAEAFNFGALDSLKGQLPVLKSQSNENEFLLQVAETIAKTLNIYFVGIYLADESNEYIVLKAGSGPVGKQLLKHGHKIRIAAENHRASQAGTAACYGEVRLVDWLGKVSGYRVFPAAVVEKEAERVSSSQSGSPLLPETLMELFLPLRVSDKTLGILELNFNARFKFTENEISKLQSLANELALALAQ